MFCRISKLTCELGIIFLNSFISSCLVYARQNWNANIQQLNHLDVTYRTFYERGLVHILLPFMTKCKNNQRKKKILLQFIALDRLDRLKAVLSGVICK